MKAGELIRMACPILSVTTKTLCMGSMCPMWRWKVPAPGGDPAGKMTPEDKKREAYCGMEGRQ